MTTTSKLPDTPYTLSLLQAQEGEGNVPLCGFFLDFEDQFVQRVIEYQRTTVGQAVEFHSVGYHVRCIYHLAEDRSRDLVRTVIMRQALNQGGQEIAGAIDLGLETIMVNLGERTMDGLAVGQDLRPIGITLDQLPVRLGILVMLQIQALADGSRVCIEIFQTDVIQRVIWLK